MKTAQNHIASGNGFEFLTAVNEYFRHQFADHVSRCTMSSTLVFILNYVELYLAFTHPKCFAVGHSAAVRLL